MPVFSISNLLHGRIVAVASGYDAEYGDEFGTAWAVRNTRYQTCLVASRLVVAKLAWEYQGQYYVVSGETEIISTNERHQGVELDMLTTSLVDDFAILGGETQRLDLIPLTPAPANTEIKVGDPVLMIAYDFKDGKAGAPYVTKGIISRPPAIDIENVRADNEKTSLIFFNAAIGVGSIGAPVLNEDLQVIGMVLGTSGTGNNAALHIDRIRPRLRWPSVNCEPEDSSN